VELVVEPALGEGGAERPQQAGGGGHDGNVLGGALARQHDPGDLEPGRGPVHAGVHDAGDGRNALVGVVGEGDVVGRRVGAAVVLDPDLGGDQGGEPGADLPGRRGRQAEHGHERADAEHRAQRGEQGAAGALQHAGQRFPEKVHSEHTGAGRPRLHRPYGSSARPPGRPARPAAMSSTPGHGTTAFAPSASTPSRMCKIR